MDINFDTMGITIDVHFLCVKTLFLIFFDKNRLCGDLETVVTEPFLFWCSIPFNDTREGVHFRPGDMCTFQRLQIALLNGRKCGLERPRCGDGGHIDLQNLMPREALDMSSA